MVSVSSKRLVKIGPVTSAENSLECRHCAATRPQYDDRRSFGTLAFEKGIGTSQFRFQRVNWQSFLYIVYKFCSIRFSDPGV